jgi:sugar O-acyltransferase (sialic acid O-acetyltransferase NeuD family)
MILGIYGSGGLGREVAGLAKQINSVSKRWEDIFFIDDNPTQLLKNGIKIITFPEMLESALKKDTEISIAIGEPEIRKTVFEKVTEKKYPLATLIHPQISLPDNTEILPGVTICMNSFVSCNVKIGFNVYIQPQTLISHDCIIEDHSVISPCAALAGACFVGKCSYLGMGAQVKEKIRIGSGSIIGMGSVVLNDIPENVIAVGNPARILKRNEEKRVFK